jgi:phospholipase C
LTGNIVVHPHNTDQERQTVTIADNSYKSSTIRQTLGPDHATAVVLRLRASHGRYDFTVKVEGSDAEGRFAGRVETGRPSLSDPLIGATVWLEKAGQAPAIRRWEKQCSQPLLPRRETASTLVTQAAA